ncbi:hypothetical protein GCM10028803_00120 [Larkinella knui]|uniref:VRR-NUC domain-containing protein n=1 Tax=Larkinella knui TaxID=2025310 RepID=A0A3P1CJQ2_9BACT|nr:VRR-NUC domain-containing protein [Larkinella knui]RRB13420.1 VRR-NUC domain-containing protein [Larkinella knui]
MIDPPFLTRAAADKILNKRPVKRKPVSQESGLQIACVRWFRMQYRDYSKLLFAIPNGGHRNKAVATKLKAEGVLAGVPDLLLAVPSGRFCGLFIEMKVRYQDGSKNYASPEQKEVMAGLHKQGYQVATCYDLTEFILTINEYLIP